MLGNSSVVIHSPEPGDNRRTVASLHMHTSLIGICRKIKKNKNIPLKFYFKMLQYHFVTSPHFVNLPSNCSSENPPPSPKVSLRISQFVISTFSSMHNNVFKQILLKLFRFIPKFWKLGNQQDC